ncbi:hypothetical protein [Flavobacterium sp. AG291]|uniref:hypothetical protein n=1 Tax=Flavobacterium sp. AG291 TaxID=2184000 RepID=UPI000E0C1318|nr:hypothetical protein [Flavobacterium sp. AG291]RDI10248.1 hypothetical protein DEU42_10864 [Flavobacterium sp. AG291]
MRTIYFLFLVLLVSACQNNNSSNQIEPQNYSIPKAVPVETSEPVIVPKYYFMVFTAEQPYELYTSYNNEKHILKRTVQHITDIEEVNIEIDEDFKYRALDNAEKNIRETALRGATNKFRMLATAYEISETEAESKIISRDLYVFDSYADASKARHSRIENVSK